VNKKHILKNSVKRLLQFTHICAQLKPVRWLGPDLELFKDHLVICHSLKSSVYYKEN